MFLQNRLVRFSGGTPSRAPSGQPPESRSSINRGSISQVPVAFATASADKIIQADFNALEESDKKFKAALDAALRKPNKAFEGLVGNLNQSEEESDKIITAREAAPEQGQPKS
jgi:hypothetical protein